MKTVKFIPTPEQWKSFDDYSSHRELLWLAVTKTQPEKKEDAKPVIEFGCGFGSTPVLNIYCLGRKRKFISYENNSEWKNKWDYVNIIEDFMKINFSAEERPGILFIDCAPGEIRKDLIAKHANNADVIIVHDTEEGAQDIYGIRDALNKFKYRLDYVPVGKPGSTALSNFINVETWI